MKKIAIITMILIFALTLTTAGCKIRKDKSSDSLSSDSVDISTETSSLASVSDSPTTSSPEETSASDGQETSSSQEMPVLSDDTSLTVSAIMGIEPSENAVTLTTAQWNALISAEALADCVDYNLADGANMEITLTDNTLSFAITAEDGTTATAQLTVNVLSDDTSLTVFKIMDTPVYGASVELSENEWLALAEAETPADEMTYAIAEGANIAATFDRIESKLAMTVTAEDGTQKAYSITTTVKTPFSKYGNGQFGSKTAFVWDNAKGLWTTGAATNSYASYSSNGQNLNGDYAFSANFKINTMANNSEIVVEAFRRSNKMIRLVLRASSENSFVIFSDYRDDSSFLNYTEHYQDNDYDGSPINLGVICYEGSMVMFINGQTAYRRALRDFGDSELVISNVSGMKCDISGIEYTNDETTVKAMHDNALKDYNDRMIGKTTGSTFNLGTYTDEDFDNDTFSIWTTLDGSNDNNKSALVSVYENGNPLYGYSWAFTGTIDVLYYASNPHVVFYTYKDNSNYCKALLNLNSSNNNNCMYRQIKNSVLGDVNLTQVAGTKGIMVNEYGIITTVDDSGTSRKKYSAPFTFIYDNGTILLYLANTLVFSYESGWSMADAVLQARKTCKMTFSNFSTTTDPAEVEMIRLQCEGGSAPASELEGDVFTVTGRAYEKASSAYAKAHYAPDGTAFAASDFYTTFTLQDLSADTWGQAEASIMSNDGNGVRFVLEYLSDGTYQIFTEKLSGEQYLHWALVAAGTTRDIHAGIIVHDGKIMFLIKVNNYQYMYSYDATGELSGKEYGLYFGGKSSRVRVKDIVTETNAQAVADFYSTLTEYTYLSPYEQRAVNYATANSDAPAGQTLLIGTSTLDYWVSTHKDSNGDYVNGYLAGLEGLADDNGDGKPDVLNFGIGATAFRDWISFYDRLIKAFTPSRIILVCGANDINEGQSAEMVYASLMKFMELMRADFPDIEVYIVAINPSPTLYNSANKQRTMSYNAMLADYAQAEAHVTLIDMTDGLADENGPIPALWDATNHMTKAGYEVFTAYIRQALGLSTD
ncbi:MAG: hypothetical protein J5762_00625 [Clostridia bacterium]|nr:hypothetical protein [Clostridia bacterium]